MKFNFSFASASLLAGALLSLASCSQDKDVAAPNPIDQATLSKISQLGFSTQNARVVDGRYLIEGDLLLSPAALNAKPTRTALRVGNDEQYYTYNVVGGLPRTLTVSLSSQFPAVYDDAVNEALRRYNDENLQLSFQRVSEDSTADIALVYSDGLGPGVLGGATGFPSNGDPNPTIRLVPSVIGNQTSDAIATIIAHEIGHCIGFRHTDYFNRAYSCGGQAVNEGSGGVGAVHVPGTPVGGDPNSWMLACVGHNVNRPFNSNDRVALNYLYN